VDGPKSPTADERDFAQVQQEMAGAVLKGAFSQLVELFSFACAYVPSYLKDGDRHSTLFLCNDNFHGVLLLRQSALSESLIL
jgi:hypothetical protein